MKLETSGNCFACGKNNPNGLRLSFDVDKEKQTVKTTFVASPVFQGWDGIVHGGILGTLLDEAMATLVYELGFHAVTASMEIKFKKPAPDPRTFAGLWGGDRGEQTIDQGQGPYC